MRKRHEQKGNSKLHVFMKPRPMRLDYDFRGKKLQATKIALNPKKALDDMTDVVRQQVIADDIDLMDQLFKFVSIKGYEKYFAIDKSDSHIEGFDIDPMMKFSEVKKKDRITYDDYSELIELLNQKEMLDKYMDKIPFKIFMDEFTVKIGNIDTGYERHSGSIYISIKRDNFYDRDRNVFFFQFHTFLKHSGYATSPFVFLVDIDKIHWKKIFGESDDGYFVLNLTSSMEDAVNVICIYDGKSASMLSLENASIVADEYAKYHRHPLRTFMADDICEHTIQLFYALCIIYRASIEMIEEKERREEFRRLQKENSASDIEEDSKQSESITTAKSREYKESSKDGNKVINLKSGIKMVMKRESFKRVKIHFRKKCNYQYSVVGHFRHYKNGKTIYVNPYNRNKDKPFRGKEYLV